MKVIKEGQYITPRRQWWWGLTARCEGCGCVVEFEEGDNVKSLVERRPNGSREAWTNCPTHRCDGVVKFYSESIR